MPRETRTVAAGPEILRRTVVPTAIGPMGVALSERGLRALVFDDEAPERVLATALPGSTWHDDPDGLAGFVAPIVAWIGGGPLPADVPLDVRGTGFQRAVWDALRAIPPGTTRSYGQIAEELGRPGAARAVGAACGANRIGVFIPCHRAVGSDGRLVNFRWGVERKRLLLERERRDAPAPG